MSESSSDRDPIERLADSFLARFRAGERPSIDEYVAKYPELADEIRELLPALARIEQDISIDGAAPGSTASGPAGGDGAPRQLGDYLILREIGRGGMGVVYEAVQQSLGRHVALKVLAQQGLSRSSHRERFRLEARSAARLHHTNIVPIYAVGEHDGTPYYAMQYIQGHGLDAIYEELRHLRGGVPSAANPPGPAPAGAAAGRAPTQAASLAHGLRTGQFARTEAGDGTESAATLSQGDGSRVTTPEPAAPESLGSAHSDLISTAEGRYYREVARVGIQVADALAYAHGQGVLHRDIKPSNLLMDGDGTVWVTDFGLAKAEGSEGPTQTGDIVGTLRYMAPERFDGWSDPRSDVYALGATLYELATLRPLFEDAHRGRLVDRVLHEEPVAPRKIDRHVPRDLETVILKALAKEPAARYPTAAALAEDLRRFADDKPILARRVSTLERTWRWSRRNPVLAGLAASLLLLMTAVTVASVVAAAQFERLARGEARTALGERAARLAAQDARAEAESEKSRAERARGEAETQKLEAERAHGEADGQRLRAEANFAKARAAVDDYLTRVSESQLLDVPGLQPLRRDLLQSALTFYQGFLKERGDDPTIRAALAETFARVATIQSQLGAWTDARNARDQAIALYEALLRETPDDIELRLNLARSYLHSGACTKAIEIGKGLVAADPAETRFRNELADAYNSQGSRQSRGGDPAGALRSYQEALTLREALVHQEPENPAFQRGLAQTLNNLGVLLQRQPNRDRDALALYRRSVEHGRIAFKKEPRSHDHGLGLAIELANVASTESQLGQYQEAARDFQEAIDLLKRLAAENPAVPSFPSYLSRYYLSLSSVQRTLGRADDAARSIRLGREVVERLPKVGATALFILASVRALCAAPTAPGEARPSADEQAERRRAADQAIEALRGAIAAGFKDVTSLRTSADLAAVRDRPDFQDLVAKLETTLKAEADVKAAQQAATRRRAMEQEEADRANAVAENARRAELQRLEADREALADRQQRAADDPGNRAHRADLAANRHAVALIHVDQGRSDEALRALGEALSLREALVADDPQDARSRLDLASTLLDLARLHWKDRRSADGFLAARRGLDQMERAHRTKPDDTTIRARLADSQWEVGDRFCAIGLFHDAAGHLNRSFEVRPSNDAFKWSMLGLVRLYLDDVAGYRDLCSRMQAQFDSNLVEVVLTCNLGPDAVPDLDDIVCRAERAAGAWPSTSPPFWKARNLALSLCRAGRIEEALRASRDVDTANPLLNRVDLALIEHAAGKADSARDRLRDLERRLDRMWVRSLGTADPMLPLSINWIELVRFLILRREAHRKIEGSDSFDDPWWHLHLSRVYSRLGERERAEGEFRAAIAARPDDPEVALSRARILARDGQVDRALADLDAQIERAPDDPRAWIDRGRLLAERGERPRADADFARAAALSPGELNRFLAAGWWVVGPYPRALEDACPPEFDPDPSRPVAFALDGAPLHWRAVPTQDDGRVYLREAFAAGPISAYALTYVYSPGERTATLLVGGHDQMRLWLNGRLVYESRAGMSQPRRSGLDRIPVVLDAGRNTLLARVSSPGDQYHFFFARLDDAPLDRAERLAELGLWDEASDRFREDFERLGSDEDRVLWNRSLMLLSLTGRSDEFRRRCAGRDSDLNSRLIGFPEGEDAGELLVKASKDVADSPGNQSLRQALMLAQYRAGQFDLVLKGPLGNRWVWPVAAMAHHRLGHSDEARQWLARIDDYQGSGIRRFLDHSPGAFPWFRLAEFEVLTREARTLIEGTDPGVEPKIREMQEIVRSLQAARDGATDAFDRRVEEAPDDPRDRLARARRLADLGRWKPADVDIARARKLQPDDREIRREANRIEVALGRADELAAVYAGRLDRASSGPAFATERNRVALELAEWDEVFTRLARQRPDDPFLWIGRGRYLALRDRWNEAAAGFARGAKARGPSIDWYEHAAVLALAGDGAGARDFASWAVGRAGDKDDPVAERVLVRMGGILPGSPLDPARTLRWAEKAAATGEPRDDPSLLGLSLYRAGRYREAIPPLEGPEAFDGHLAQKAQNRLVLAMAHFRLDDAARARQVLERAIAVIPPWGNQTAPPDWVGIQLLRREAEALILGPSGGAASPRAP
jgi:serine/threonine protein kinase/predicted Zn-dependent protease